MYQDQRAAFDPGYVAFSNCMEPDEVRWLLHHFELALATYPIQEQDRNKRLLAPVPLMVQA
jgi:hypothetical protein